MIMIKIQDMKWLAMMLMAVVLLAACSSGSGDAPEIPQTEATTAPIILTISTPKPSSQTVNARVGDPGEDPNETYDDWNRLTIIVAYKEKTQGVGIVDPNPEKMIYSDTFTKADFDSDKDVIHKESTLSPSSLVPGYHEYTMYLPLGTVNVYAVTYSVNEENATQKNDKLNFDISTDEKLNTLINSNKDNITALKISNDYAGGPEIDKQKFLSVATGYAQIVKPGKEDNGSRDLTVSKGNDMEMKQYWQMKLTRLATKLDIQWDAKSAYDKKDDLGNLVYTDVKVSDFTYNGGATGLAENEKSGYGRLFPSLQTATATAIGGTKTFVNTSKISKRNGRQYHYFYPDGSKNPSITFSLTTQKESESTEEKKDYTFKFDESNVLPLQQGAWYKINTTIKGQSTANTTITIGNSSN